MPTSTSIKSMGSFQNTVTVFILSSGLSNTIFLCLNVLTCRQNAQETHEDPAQLFVLDVSRSGTFIDDVRVPGVRDASGTQHLQFDRNDYRFDGAVRALKTPWTRVLDGQIVRFGEESYRLQKVNLVVCFSKFSTWSHTEGLQQISLR